jgi:hypothetical protein
MDGSSGSQCGSGTTADAHFKKGFCPAAAQSSNDVTATAMTSQHKSCRPQTMACPKLPVLFMTRTLCARIWMRLVLPSVRTILIRDRIAPWLAQTATAREALDGEVVGVSREARSPGREEKPRWSDVARTENRMLE